MLQILVVAFLNAPLPCTPSTVEIELPKPMSALPSSTPRTLAMPAPGSTWMARPGTAFSHISLSWPPSGIHEPPCGPVIIFRLAAAAGAAMASARPRPKPNVLIDSFMAFPSPGPLGSAGQSFLLPVAKGTRAAGPRTRASRRNTPCRNSTTGRWRTREQRTTMSRTTWVATVAQPIQAPPAACCGARAACVKRTEFSKAGSERMRPSSTSCALPWKRPESLVKKPTVPFSCKRSK